MLKSRIRHRGMADASPMVLISRIGWVKIGLPGVTGGTDGTAAVTSPNINDIINDGTD